MKPERSADFIKKLTEEVRQAEESSQLLIRDHDVRRAISVAAREVGQVRSAINQMHSTCPDLHLKALEYAFKLYEGAPFIFHVERDKSVGAHSGAEIIDFNQIDRFWQGLGLVLLPAFFANGAIWPAIEGIAFETCHRDVLTKYSQSVSALFGDFAKTLDIVLSRNRRGMIEAFLRSLSISPIQLTGIALLTITFFSLVPCRFQSETEGKESFQ